MARRSLTSLEPVPSMDPPTSMINSVSMASSSAPSSMASIVIQASMPSSACSVFSSDSTPNSVQVVLVNTTHMPISTTEIAAPTSGPVVTETLGNKETVIADTAVVGSGVDKLDYKLSEIVEREKNQLFSYFRSGMELEPPLMDVYSARRHSRPFFTLTEEEENDELVPSGNPPNLEGKTVRIDPVFYLGESLSRLYFPKEYRQKGGRRRPKSAPKESKGENEEESSKTEKNDIQKSCDDMAATGGLYRKISSLYSSSIRRTKSNSELENMHQSMSTGNSDNFNTVDAFDYSTFSKSRSLPTTPKVSPKLGRKNKNQTTDDIVEKSAKTEASGPGFSFLARVAGNVRMHKEKQEKMHKEEERKRQEKQAVCHISEKQTVQRNTEPLSVVAHNKTETTSTQVSKTHPSAEVTENSFRPRSYSNESDSGSEGPAFVKNIINWSTKKMKVSSKEANVWSPTSF